VTDWTGAFGPGALFAGAVATGILGSAHCLGMCGGVIGALCLGKVRRGAAFHLFYHAGRIATYVGLGALVAWVGLAAVYTSGPRDAGRAVLIAADAFVLLAGLGMTLEIPWLQLARLSGSRLARPLAGALGALLRLPSSAAAFPIGLLLGLLPCGLLYAMLVTAAVTANPLQGAQVMLGFGLGTSPALLAAGTASRFLGARARGRMLRTAGLLLAFLGAYNLVHHLAGGGCH
jgi:sulfite exporter TauE/SafE